MKRDILPCSCGNPETHVIAERQTADGKIIKLWSDGAITSLMNWYIRHGARKPATVQARLDSGWALLEQACLYDFNEFKAMAQ